MRARILAPLIGIIMSVGIHGHSGLLVGHPYNALAKTDLPIDLKCIPVFNQPPKIDPLGNASLKGYFFVHRIKTRKRAIIYFILLRTYDAYAPYGFRSGQGKCEIFRERDGTNICLRSYCYIISGSVPPVYYPNSGFVTISCVSILRNDANIDHRQICSILQFGNYTLALGHFRSDLCARLQGMRDFLHSGGASACVSKRRFQMLGVLNGTSPQFIGGTPQRIGERGHEDGRDSRNRASMSVNKRTNSIDKSNHLISGIIFIIGVILAVFWVVRQIFVKH